MPIATVFLDKDGTLVDNVPYNVDIQKIAFAPDVFTALRRLSSQYNFIIVSNQSGIDRGLFSEPDLQKIAFYIRDVFKEHGLTLLDFYFCPHHQTPCFCRKPQAGLLWQARMDHGIDLSSSWMIGDILDDIECGHRAGCRALLLNNGNETKWEFNALRRPDAMVHNFTQATDYILRHTAYEHLEPSQTNFMRTPRQHGGCGHDNPCPAGP